MGFTLYPDPAVRALRVSRQGAFVDTEFTQRAGDPLPDFTGVYQRMMYVRVAMVGGAGTPAPTLSIIAGSGPPVEIGIDSKAVFRATGPGGAGVRLRRGCVPDCGGRQRVSRAGRIRTADLRAVEVAGRQQRHRRRS